MRRVAGFVLVTVALAPAATGASAQGFGTATAVVDRDVFLGAPVTDAGSGGVYLYRLDSRGR